MIQIAEYNPEWPRRFEHEAGKVRRALAGRALLIGHAGSTAVPGLPAKPVIDIVLAVADATNEADYLPALEAAGYQLRIREPEWFEHRLFKTMSQDVNLHVFPHGCPEIARMLAFRDWLRAHPDDRDLYARTKQDLARCEWDSVDSYKPHNKASAKLIGTRRGDQSMKYRQSKSAGGFPANRRGVFHTVLKGGKNEHQSQKTMVQKDTGKVLRRDAAPAPKLFSFAKRTNTDPA